jgi:hypothetical protein
MKKEKQFVKITGIIKEAYVDGIKFGFLVKMELSDPSETCEIVRDDNYGAEFLDRLEWFLQYKKDLDIDDILYSVKREIGVYSDDSAGNVRAYLDLEYITEEEFNDSDKWEKPTKEMIREMID